MAVFEKGYLFQPSFLDILETFTKASDRDAINMAIHRFMFRGEEPSFNNVDLKRTWIGLLPYLRKSRDMALKKDREGQDNIETMSEKGQDLVKTKSGLSQDKVYLKEIRNIRNKDEGETPIVPQRGNVSASFEKFWKAYPRHEAKQRAIPALERALKKTDIDTILNAIEKQKNSEKWLKDNGQFIPHPATWLNGGCWDDEITVAETEPEKEYHPITPLERCKVCGSRNVSTRGLYSQCLNNDCGVSYRWSSRKGDWLEES